MRDAVRWGLRAFILLRLVATSAALVSYVALTPHETVSVPGYEPPDLGGLASSLFGVWLRADSLWYLKIAEQGYGPELGTFAFFPLFPVLTSVLDPLFFGRELYAALFVSNLASACGLILFYLFVNELLDDRAARICIFGLALFPTSFFLVAPYAEPLLIAFGSLALLMAVRGRPLYAGLAGMLAALSRPFGVLVAIPLAVLSIRGREKNQRVEKAKLASAAGPFLGLGGWLAFVAFQTGDAMFPFKVQSLWQRHFTFFPLTLLEGVTEWLKLSRTAFGPYLLFDLVLTVILIALIVAVHVVLTRKKGILQSWAWGITLFPSAMILFALSLRFAPRPLLSVPRFALAGFTAFLGLALLPKRTLLPLAIVSGAGLALTTALFVAARPIF